MSDDVFFDEGMVCTPDDPSPFGPDETGIWELPEYGEGIGPGPDETGIWEVPDLQTPAIEPEPSVIVDWESEPTVVDTEPPAFPEVEGGETAVEAGETAVEGVEAGEAAVEGIEAGEIAVEAAEGLELLDVLEVGALLLL